MENIISINRKSIIDHAGNTFHSIDDDIVLIDNFIYIPEGIIQTEETIAIEVIKGSGDVIINGVSHECIAPCLVFLLPGLKFVIKINEHCNLVTRGMCLTNNFMNELYGMSLELNEIRISLLVNPIIKLDAKEKNRINLLITDIKEISSNESNEYKAICIRHLFVAYFYGSLKQICNTERNVPARVNKIALKFHNLAMAYYKTEHKLSFYASKICISENYLYSSIKLTTGKTPLFWINLRLINQARNELRTRNKSIEEISNELNFCSQSHFSRFFKKETGVTPIAFRNHIKETLK